MRPNRHLRQARRHATRHLPEGSKGRFTGHPKKSPKPPKPPDTADETDDNDWDDRKPCLPTDKDR